MGKVDFIIYVLDSYWPIFIIIFTVDAVEAFLRNKWNVSYFRWGIPIHIKKIDMVQNWNLAPLQFNKRERQFCV